MLLFNQINFMFHIVWFLKPAYQFSTCSVSFLVFWGLWHHSNFEYDILNQLEIIQLGLVETGACGEVLHWGDMPLQLLFHMEWASMIPRCLLISLSLLSLSLLFISSYVISPIASVLYAIRRISKLLDHLKPYFPYWGMRLFPFSYRCYNMMMGKKRITYIFLWKLFLQITMAMCINFSHGHVPLQGVGYVLCDSATLLLVSLIFQTPETIYLWAVCETYRTTPKLL